MISRFAPWLVPLLRLPSEPPNPFGDEKTLRVFRASPRFLKYQLVTWTIAHVILVPVMLLPMIGLVGAAIASRNEVVTVILAGLVLTLLLLIGAYLVVSYLLVHLDYSMRWYKVTDRSLRIREGVFFIRELTMTVANIQNIELSQGPIQRWLGIADVKVQSAGGGGGGQAGRGANQQTLFSMHVGHFRGVDNAEEILELMQERLRRCRSAGLGDPDDAVDLNDPAGSNRVSSVASTPPQAQNSASAVAAARNLLDECRALRVGLTATSSSASSDAGLTAT